MALLHITFEVARNVHDSEVSGLVEGSTFHVLQLAAVSYDNTPQHRAVVKCLFPNVLHTFWNVNLLNLTASEQIIAYLA